MRERRAGSLKSLKVVKSAYVSVKAGQATVSDDDAQADVEQIKKQIEPYGFSTTTPPPKQARKN